MVPIFDGWLSFGGQEILNGPRTKAYLQHLQPSLSLGDDCCECDTLAAALGHEPYSTPSQDDAEWFNPYATETGGFYGLIPLSVEGFDDSTWTVPLVDLMSDGSMSGRGRRSGRDLRFKALAVAESEKAMSRGLSWLRDTLGGENCAAGDCGGAQLCYLTDCPGCCAEDAPEVVEVVDHLDYRAMTYAQVVAAASADWASAASPDAMESASGQKYAFWSGPAATIERTLHGFVPGATYRLALDFGSLEGHATEIGVTLPGAAELLAPRRVDVAFGYAQSPEQGVAVWEFIATECDHRLVIESTADLMLGMLDVAITAPDALAYSGQPAYYPSQSTSWTPNLTGTPVTTSQPAIGMWQFLSATNYVIGAGLGEVRSVIPGLKPNRTYRATILSTVYHTTAGVPGVVTVYDAQGAVLGVTQTTATALGSGLYGSWATVEFLASDRAAYLSVANASAVTVGPANTLTVGVRAATVEEVLAVPVIPDPNDPLRRYFRDVVLTSGPSVGQVYPSYTAVMKEIEWTMRANQPDPFGEDILVTSSLGAGQWIVPEVACAMGEAVRTNYVPNPSGEYGVLGWSVPAGSTITNPLDASARSGSHVIRMTITAVNSTLRAAQVSQAVPAKPGTTWTLTVPGRASNASRGVRAQLNFIAGAALLSSTFADRTMSESLTDWQEVSVTATAPPGTTSVVAYVVALPGATAWTAGEVQDYDGLMLEQMYGPRAYFDGDSLFGTWSGTPGNSTSGYERTNAVLVFDPACPPTPPAPRPPDIVNLCLTTPDTWIRYVLDLPALASAASPRAAPVITIGTGAADARGVRVRVYANPFARTIEEIDPCAYCGEFLISYMPAQASLTIDGADKSATVTTSMGEQSALSLLFGSDGGPVTWPTIGCAIPYLVTVDVDADVAPLIAASLSVTPIF